MMMKKQIKLLILFLVSILVLFGLYQYTRPTGNDDLKTITFNVVSLRDEYFTTSEYKTDKQFLSDFLIEEDLIVYEDSQYGIYIRSVSDLNDDTDEQYWWAILIDDQMAEVGANEIVLEDGVKYTLELFQGY